MDYQWIINGFNGLFMDIMDYQWIINGLLMDY